MRNTIIVLLVGLVWTGIFPAFAQEGLTAEEQALLERVVASISTLETYNSYQVSLTTANTQNISFSMGGNATTLTDSSITSQIEATVIDPNTENPNVSGTVVAMIAASEITRTGDSQIDAEFRFVEGKLYVNAQYAEGMEGNLPLPEGWTEVENLDTLAQSELLAPLSLDVLLSSILAEAETEDVENLLATLTNLSETATSITLTEEEIDGTPAEVVSINFDWSAMQRFIGEELTFMESGSMLEGVFEGMEGEIASLRLYMGENDAPLGYDFSLNIDLGEADISGMSNQLPAGTVVTVLINTQQSVRFSGINETFEAATAP